MIYTFKKYKIIIKVSPKAACTSVKHFLHLIISQHDEKFFYLMGNKHPHDISLFNYLRSTGQYFLNSKTNYSLLREDGYLFLILFRDPIDRFYSAINQKFICHYPSYNKRLLEFNCPSPKLKNFYLWFLSNISDSIGDMRSKDLIDFHCRNINHNYEIDPHLSPISELIPHEYLPYSKILDINSGLINKLNTIFNSNIENISHNVMRNSKPSHSFMESDFLGNCYPDSRVKHESSYYIESVKKSFAADYETISIISSV
tara:strand:+ start:1729 stop:2502 length:774 start_codon:yes stop_codon:yes gene_type:complete